MLKASNERFFPARYKMALLLSLLAVPAATAWAQSGGGLELSWSTIDGGGASPSNASTGGSYTLSGTIGQPDAQSAAMSGGSFTVFGGFWGVVLPACTTFAPVDFDRDCDVDGDDFDQFDACFTGPAISGPPAWGCSADQFNAADADDDSDVDQSDFGIFQRCYSGENIAWDPHCAE